MRSSLVASLVLLASGIACRANTPREDVVPARVDAAAPQVASTPRSLAVATFNTGLAPGAVPYVEERRARLPEAIASLDADAVCLQEVWFEDQFAPLKEALRVKFPYVARPLPANDGRARGCSARDFDRASVCLADRCAGVPDHLRGGCALNQCGDVAAAIAPACVECITSDPRRSLDAVSRACRTEETVRGASPADAGAAPLVYGGSYGLAIFSRAPLDEVEVRRLPSTLAARGALHAHFVHWQRDVHLFCTHLTATIATRKGPATPRDERQRQIKALLAYVAERAPEGTPALIAGDLNMGPQATRLRGRDDDLYGQLLGAGYTAAVYEGESPCSYCDGEPGRGSASETGLLLDHVLFRSDARETLGTARATRIFDEPLASDGAGIARRFALSDHYGVIARFDAR